MNAADRRGQKLRRAGAVLAMGAAFSLAAACATEITGSAQQPGAAQQSAAGTAAAGTTGGATVPPPMSGSEGAPPAQGSDPRESDDGMGTASAQLPDQTATFEPPTVSAVVPESIDPGGDGGATEESAATPADPGTPEDTERPTARADTGGDPGGATTSSGGSPGVPETDGAQPGAGAAALNWPDDLCGLLPEGLEEEEGVERQESDPALRCMYSGTSDGEYQMVTVLKVGRINPEQPMAGNGTDLREEKIGGDASWSYQQDKSAVAMVAVGDDGFSVSMAYDGASATQLRQATVNLAGYVLEQLTG